MAGCTVAKLGANAVRRTAHNHAAGSAWVEGKSWRLADEVRYIQRRAARREGRFVSVGQVALLSTDHGDGWLLDPSERLAICLAHDGAPQAVGIEESAMNFTVAWTGHYRIKGAAFIYQEHESGKVVAILGYPTTQIAQLS